MGNKKLTVTLKPWNYTCSDGCCSEYGTTVTVNGISVTDNGDQDHILLKAILNHLGYDVDIIGLDEGGEESWRA